jgi:hypothetical protein
MKKELKEKLEKALQEAGLDKGLLAFITITKEDEIQGVIDNLKGLSTQKPIEEIIKEKEFQSEIDRRISEAKKKWEESNKQDPPKDPPKEGALTTEDITKIIAEAQKPLLEKLEGFEKNKSRDAKIAEARKLLSDSKIPEKLRESRLKYFNPDNDEKLEDWVKQQEEEHEAYQQALIDNGTLSGQPPKYAGDTEPTQEELDSILEASGV